MLEVSSLLLSGDKTSVTVMGHGTGAACLHYLMTSDALPHGNKHNQTTTSPTQNPPGLQFFRLLRVSFAVEDLLAGSRGRTYTIISLNCAPLSSSLLLTTNISNCLTFLLKTQHGLPLFVSLVFTNLC